MAKKQDRMVQILPAIQDGEVHPVCRVNPQAPRYKKIGETDEALTLREVHPMKVINTEVVVDQDYEKCEYELFVFRNADHEFFIQMGKRPGVDDS